MRIKILVSLGAMMNFRRLLNVTLLGKESAYAGEKLLFDLIRNESSALGHHLEDEILDGDVVQTLLFDNLCYETNKAVERHSGP